MNLPEMNLPETVEALRALPLFVCDDLARLCLADLDEPGAPAILRRYAYKRGRYVDRQALHVLADWLCERGDSRGEMLQFELRRRAYILQTYMMVCRHHPENRRASFECRYGVQVRHFPFARNLFLVGGERVSATVNYVGDLARACLPVLFSKIKGTKEPWDSRGLIPTVDRPSYYIESAREASSGRDDRLATSVGQVRYVDGYVDAPNFLQRAESWSYTFDSWYTFSRLKSFRKRLVAASAYLSRHVLDSETLANKFAEDWLSGAFGKGTPRSVHGALIHDEELHGP